jgi:TRAP transporter 4TM/12TM fusion protein
VSDGAGEAKRVAPADATPGAPVWPAAMHRQLLVYGAAIAAVHVWFNTMGTMSSLHFNALHLAMLGSYGFLVVGATAGRGRAARALDLVAAAAVAAGGVYLPLAIEALHQRGEIMVPLDAVMAAVTVVAVLWLCRRTSGWVVPALMVLCLAYVTFLGREFGGMLHFKGLSWERILHRFYFTSEGLFGLVADISSTYVFMFLLFAAFLLKSGGGDYIVALARTATGRSAAGPGYIATGASALMGTITGSAVANVVSTGAMTIPLMQRAGFRPVFAAAVEVAASTGAQILPPVMGAGAFIMAQWTGIPYGRIVALSILPALLYFASVAFSVYCHTGKIGLRASPAPEGSGRGLGRLLRDGVRYHLPLGGLVVVLVAGFTPTYAAALGIAAIVACSWLPGPGPRMTPRLIVEALALGTRNMVATGVLLIGVGIVIGALNLTGLSVAFSQMVVDWAGGQMLPILLLSGAVSIVLGMGLPTTAAYVMLAIVAVPALERVGVPVLAAHLIIFWFAQSSNVTPPVCLAAFAGAAIAQTPPMRTGVVALQIAKAVYLVPLLFAFTPLIDGTWGERLEVFAGALAGLFALTAATSGWWLRPLGWEHRALLVLLALALFWPAWPTHLVGLAGLATAGWLWRRR